MTDKANIIEDCAADDEALLPALPLIGRRLVHSNMDQDAVEIGALYRKVRGSMIESMQYAIEAGQRLIAKKAQLAYGEWLPWLEANSEVLGFETPQTAGRLMKAATLCVDAQFDDNDVNEALRLNRIVWGNNVRGTLGTGENEWFTPNTPLWPIITMAREVLGGIDLDPATHAQAQQIVQADQFFTKENDGLKQEWHGRVWLNPPYAQPAIADFVAKMCAERRAGRVTAAIMLTHNYTDTSWFHEAAGIADAICFTSGRVKFYESDGRIAEPTQGQAFFYFGADVKLFATRFAEIGFVVPTRFAD